MHVIYFHKCLHFDFSYLYIKVQYYYNVCCLPVYLSILIKHESCLSVCLFVRVFQSHQKYQGHEILALGLIWANLKHVEARFSKFSFLRILGAFSCLNKISAILTPRTMKFGHKDYFNTKKNCTKNNSEKFQFLGHLSGVFTYTN